MVVGRCRCVSGVVIGVPDGLIESGVGVMVCVVHGDLLAAINYTPWGYIPGRCDPCRAVDPARSRRRAGRSLTDQPGPRSVAGSITAVFAGAIVLRRTRELGAPVDETP